MRNGSLTARCPLTASSFRMTRACFAAVFAFALLSFHDTAVCDAPLRIDRLVVHKAARQMEAFFRGVRVRSFHVAIGGGALGAKMHAGDRRTPEGSYRIDSRHRSDTFHRFLHVSYPNAADRRRFQAARRARQVPPAARIGGEIGVHGEPRGLSLLAPNVRDAWTDGCIAVANTEIEALYAAVVPNAVIEILP